MPEEDRPTWNGHAAIRQCSTSPAPLNLVEVTYRDAGNAPAPSPSPSPSRQPASPSPSSSPGSTGCVLSRRREQKGVVPEIRTKRHRLVRISGTTPFASLLSEQQHPSFSSAEQDAVPVAGLPMSGSPLSPNLKIPIVYRSFWRRTPSGRAPVPPLRRRGRPVRDGRAPNGSQRWRCQACGRRYGSLAGTIFEHTKADFPTWVAFASAMCRNCQLSHRVFAAVRTGQDSICVLSTRFEQPRLLCRFPTLRSGHARTPSFRYQRA